MKNPPKITAADVVFSQLLADVMLCRRAARDPWSPPARVQKAKKFEAESWRDLARYLSTGDYDPAWLNPADRVAKPDHQPV